MIYRFKIPRTSVTYCSTAFTRGLLRYLWKTWTKTIWDRDDTHRHKLWLCLSVCLSVTGCLYMCVCVCGTDHVDFEWDEFNWRKYRRGDDEQGKISTFLSFSLKHGHTRKKIIYIYNLRTNTNTKHTHTHISTQPQTNRDTHANRHPYTQTHTPTYTYRQTDTNPHTLRHTQIHYQFILPLSTNTKHIRLLIGRITSLTSERLT